MLSEIVKAMGHSVQLQLSDKEEQMQELNSLQMNCAKPRATGNKHQITISFKALFPVETEWRLGPEP